jgi:hypothetical protein
MYQNVAIVLFSGGHFRLSFRGTVASRATYFEAVRQATRRNAWIWLVAPDLSFHLWPIRGVDLAKI